MVCKNCSERHLGCHGTCESYLEYRKAQDKMLHDRYIQGQARRNYDNRSRRKTMLSTHKDRRDRKQS